MRKIKLNTDTEIPIIGLGTFLSKPGEVYQAVRWAIKLGYRHIDCAEVYGNQSEIGQAIHDAIAEGDVKRDELFITSKLWNDSHDPKDVRPALEKTLEELQLEYVDLYLMHWPVALKKGVGMPKDDDDWIDLSKQPLEKTWAAMENLYNDGLAKAIGVSNFNEKNLQLLIDKGEVVPAVNQVECHPYLSQDGLIEFCRQNNIAVTAYSPLGAEHSDGSLLEDETIMDIAEKNKITSAQVVLSWQMQRGVAVIPKSVHEDRLRENFAALTVELDEDDMQKLGKLNKGKRFFDGKFFENSVKGYAEIF